MRNIILLLLLACCYTLSYSQLDPVWGIKAGPTLRTAFLNGEDVAFSEEKSAIVVGFQIGGIVDIELSDQVTLRSGLSIISKGTKIKDDSGNDYVFSPVYLELPFNFLFHVADFRIGGGPYLAIGIGGNMKRNGSNKQKIEFGNDQGDDWSSIDIGLGVQANRTVGEIEVGLGLEFGISDMTPKFYTDDGLDYHIHNFSINFTAAYFFKN